MQVFLVGWLVIVLVIFLMLLWVPRKNNACCLLRMEILLALKFICRHCIKTEHIYKKQCKPMGQICPGIQAPGTHLLKSQELDKTSIQLCSLIILTALLQLCIFVFSPQIFSSFLLLPFPFISNHFWQLIQHYQPLLWRSSLDPQQCAPSLLQHS